VVLPTRLEQLMNDVSRTLPFADREAVLHAHYEAAELEHNLMCTYLYAAFSLKDAPTDGLSVEEVEAVRRWRGVLIGVAIEEMGHLAAVWNITSALGGSPRVGRTNFPIDPGYLPASVVVKLAPFTPETLQHFVFLERPHGSTEHDGDGFAAERNYVRGADTPRLVPMGINYDTVGEFYAALAEGLRGLATRYGESATFGGDPALQLSPREITLAGVKPVVCLKTALAAFDAIVVQGEGAPRDSAGSHYQKFVGIREEFQALKRRNPAFAPAFPAATNPVLRRPPRPEGRVWLENPEAVAVVDLANAAYGLMLRLLSYAYALRGPTAEKSLAVDLAIGLMRAIAPLAERAARLPAGPSNPECHAGMSFTALRDSSALPAGIAAWRLFTERFSRLADAATGLRACNDPRVHAAADQLNALAGKAARGSELSTAAAAGSQAFGRGRAERESPPQGAALAAAATPVSTIANGVETARGQKLELMFEAKRCIHSRFCVTGTPEVFLANVQGPWIRPDAAEVERVVEIAHACPSGAIRYRRLDGVHGETAPPVNLLSIRESGPYAVRGDLRIGAEAGGFRATLCRCGASKNKPFCDGSHHEVGFAATGEPPSRETEMLPVRDGVLSIDPELNGPLAVRGNLEIMSGTGRVVARVVSARLCRCGGSASKPFCDGSHARIGFKSTAP
jgi:CDGSH-type Zn-finger protein/uncharacterized Fe-S cluster protein YjdI